MPDSPASAASLLDVRVLEPAQAARELAAEIAQLVRSRAAAGRGCVLGFATGSTPTGVYDELIRMRREERLDFSGVTAVNLDDYLGLETTDPRSFRAWMRANLFDALELPPERALIPLCELRADEIGPWCRTFEERLVELGGIDLQILGLGRNGHIGFNEPGSGRASRTRRVELAARTREDAAAAWGALEHVPTHAVTLGLGTILEARALRVLAFGEHKRGIVARVLGDPVGDEVPATFVREHPDARLYVDAAARGGS